VRGEIVELGDSRAVLVAENMSPPPEGKVYDTWLLRGGVPKPAGLFVTVEPSGGSPAPTEEPILIATL
jgi:hypothetical protein